MRRPLAPSTSLTAVSAATTPSSPGLNSATSKLSVGGAEFRPEQRRPLITNRRARRLRCMPWRARGWIQLVAATALVAAACGANNGPATANHAPQTSPSPTGTVASSPSSGSMCDPSHHCLAMVTLRGSDQLVIRDLTDIAHPKTIGTAGRAFQLLGYGPALEGAGGQFVSSSEISYLGGQTHPYYALPNTLFRRPISGSGTAAGSGSRGMRSRTMPRTTSDPRRQVGLPSCLLARWDADLTRRQRNQQLLRGLDCGGRQGRRNGPAGCGHDVCVVGFEPVLSGRKGRRSIARRRDQHASSGGPVDQAEGFA